jgi:hypothetical protein
MASRGAINRAVAPKEKIATAITKEDRLLVARTQVTIEVKEPGKASALTASSMPTPARPESSFLPNDILNPSRHTVYGSVHTDYSIYNMVKNEENVKKSENNEKTLSKH